METENHSASQSGVEKPPSTPEMSAHDAEDMVNSMLQDSPLPNMERGNEEIPEGDGSDKLPKEGRGEKLPEGGNDKLPDDTPADKLVPLLYLKSIFSLLLI